MSEKRQILSFLDFKNEFRRRLMKENLIIDMAEGENIYLKNEEKNIIRVNHILGHPLDYLLSLITTIEFLEPQDDASLVLDLARKVSNQRHHIKILEDKLKRIGEVLVKKEEKR